MKSNTRLRQRNIKRTLSEIRANGPISKRELQQVTGFSWGNISSITTLLMKEEIIMSSGKQETLVGRKPEEFDINTQDNYIIGVDFHMDGVLVVLCDLKGRTVKKYTAPFETRTKDCTLDTLYRLLEQAIGENSSKNITHIAIAMQAEVDTEKGIAVRNGTIEGWRDVPIGDLLQKRFNKNVFVLHDPDCLLYAESYCGQLCGKQTQNAVLLRIEHGVGIAAMLNGEIYKGVKGFACEIGPTVIPKDNDDGWTRLHDVVVKKAIEQAYAHKKGQWNEYDVIVALGRAGDTVAKEVFNECGRAIGFALVNAIYLLNPETVILFGETAECTDLYLDETVRVLSAILGDKMPEIVASKLDEEGAAIGAALFAADSMIDKMQFVE